MLKPPSLREVAQGNCDGGSNDKNLRSAHLRINEPYTLMQK